VGYVEDAFEGRTPLADFFSTLSGLALAQFRKMGEGGKGRWRFLRPARRRLSRVARHLIPLVFIVVTIETEQLPVASVRGIVVMVVIFVMDCELTQLLPVKFPPAVCTDPWKHFEGFLAVGLLQLSLGAPCHANLGDRDSSILQ